MNTEKQKLIQELLDDQASARREATLAAGRQILRRRRRHRAVVQAGLGLVGILAVTALTVQSIKQRFTPPIAVSEPLSSNEPPEPKSLTDAELLALFPETPVGLITLEDGRKRLIFPRAGDEARFIKRM